MTAGRWGAASQSDTGLRATRNLSVGSATTTACALFAVWTRRQSWDIVMKQLAMLFPDCLRPEVLDAL
ncbi:MAG: hypothetical protein IPM24_25480 [Bryobacterales bacterium]|nr:hypothetical protein [Bryobacterales bacterium]